MKPSPLFAYVASGFGVGGFRIVTLRAVTHSSKKLGLSIPSLKERFATSSTVTFLPTFWDNSLAWLAKYL